jgi:hypothetical protein
MERARKEMTGSKSIRKFHEVDDFGRVLSRTLYIVQGTQFPPSRERARWCEVTDFNETECTGRNFKALFDAVRRNGCEVVKKST